MTEENITSLRPRPSLTVPASVQEPCEKVIDALEFLLKEAREGKIYGLAYAAVRPDQAVLYNWRIGAHGVSFPLVGALAMLQAEFVAGVIEAAVDEPPLPAA